MLSRPEYGTREDIRLWLSGKDPNEQFNWKDSWSCACAQYCLERTGKNDCWLGAISELNDMGRSLASKKFKNGFPRGYSLPGFSVMLSFGELLAEVDRLWAEPAL